MLKFGRDNMLPKQVALSFTSTAPLAFKLVLNVAGDLLLLFIVYLTTQSIAQPI
jgi:hypothetical protein